VRIKSPPVQLGEIKNTGIAAIASFVIPGLGQIYCGEIGRGIMIFIGFVISCLLIMLIIGIIIAPLFWVWNVYDAYTLAKKINAGEIKV
jgi:TM2 domain-containing membrane protein YozV